MKDSEGWALLRGLGREIYEVASFWISSEPIPLRSRVREGLLGAKLQSLASYSVGVHHNSQELCKQGDCQDIAKLLSGLWVIGMISVVCWNPFRLNPLSLGGLKQLVKKGLLCIAKIASTE